ncbi:MAG TPA: hypothetical protein ENI36_00345 [Thermoplasmatales archaeon]|nr:MAG: hypothetical protein DRQ25_04885 [Candidatus Fermentibacteria bacterium]HEC72034.1 hypothetical protein [Thermoplasmatales archaeon]
MKSKPKSDEEKIIPLRLIQDRSEFSAIGTCKCGRTLSMTNLHKAENEPLFAEARMICGGCQTIYRFLILEQE